ncbi:MAG TPA: hypothetical protein DCR55_10465 [Lentisphaeria bacterium]|nr:hypothetical protein [Lentisphaeria bacterium]
MAPETGPDNITICVNQVRETNLIEISSASRSSSGSKGRVRGSRVFETGGAYRLAFILPPTEVVLLGYGRWPRAANDGERKTE